MKKIKQLNLMIRCHYIFLVKGVFMCLSASLSAILISDPERT